MYMSDIRINFIQESLPLSPTVLLIHGETVCMEIVNDYYENPSKCS